MDVNRRQKVNLNKHRRTQALKSEYKMKIKDQHIENVKQRRASMDNMKTMEIKSNAAQKERKRASRLKMLANTTSINALKCRSLSAHQRRENVLQRKQQMQQQKDQKKKEEYLQKQRKREKRITRALHKKKSTKALRPQSATTSFLQADKSKINDENKLNRSFQLHIGHHNIGNNELSDNASDDVSSDFMKKDNGKRIVRSKSSSFIQQENLRPLTQKKKKKRKRRKTHNFMRPTLSAYLCTNNPGNLIAMAIN